MSRLSELVFHVFCNATNLGPRASRILLLSSHSRVMLPRSGIMIHGSASQLALALFLSKENLENWIYYGDLNTPIRRKPLLSTDTRAGSPLYYAVLI